MERIQQYDDSARSALSLEDAVIALAFSSGFPAQPQRRAAPILSGLKQAGTRHVHIESAAIDAIEAVASDGEGTVLDEVDGNAIDQALLSDVLDDHLAEANVGAWVAALRRHQPDLPDRELRPLLYTIALARIGAAIVKRFAGSRAWVVSLQLHTDGVGDVERSVRWGRLLRSMVPRGRVRVPFAPNAPECFLVMRDLQAIGIPVELSPAFSARHVAAAALLGRVDCVDLRLGRIDAGSGDASAGASETEACLAAQRLLRGLRRRHDVETQLVVSDLPSWQSILDVAGCDIHRAPPGVLEELLAQTEIDPEAIASRVGTPDDAIDAHDTNRSSEDSGDAIARLLEVEPDFVEFLLDYADSDEFRDARDGASVAARFQEAGFGDLFDSPSEAEWKVLASSQRPDADSELIGRLAPDTEQALRVAAELAAHQARIDRTIADAAQGA